MKWILPIEEVKYCLNPTLDSSFEEALSHIQALLQDGKAVWPALLPDRKRNVTYLEEHLA